MQRNTVCSDSEVQCAADRLRALVCNRGTDIEGNSLGRGCVVNDRRNWRYSKGLDVEYNESPPNIIQLATLVP